jgi:hypothetical protein
MSNDWIYWRGGKQPVADNTLVEVARRDGTTGESHAQIYRWDHQENCGDIMRYRVVEKAEQVDADANWLEWRGFALGLHEDTIVDIELRSGSRDCGVRAGDYRWSILNESSDIVRFRIVKKPDFVLGEEWTIWTGGECPIQPTDVVQVRLRSGVVAENADSLYAWRHHNLPGDIVAYRVVGKRIHRPPFGTPAGEEKSIRILDDSDLSALNTAPIDRAMAAGGDETGYTQTITWSREQSVRNELLSDDITSAPSLLMRAKQHMDDRAATYDQPGGERSMGKTVEMFNIATGRNEDHLGRAISHVNNLLAMLRNYGTDIDPKRAIEPLEGIQKMLQLAGSISVSESEGWLLMQCLKMVRDRSGKPHRDSIEDNVAYGALYGEARLREVQS